MIYLKLNSINILYERKFNFNHVILYSRKKIIFFQQAELGHPLSRYLKQECFNSVYQSAFGYTIFFRSARINRKAFRLVTKTQTTVPATSTNIPNLVHTLVPIVLVLS